MEAHLDARALRDAGLAATRPAIPFAFQAVAWALAAVSVGSLLANDIFQGRPASLLSMGLVGVAAYQWLRAVPFLSRKDSAFILVALLSFVGAQTVYREWANGPAASSFGFDFSAYYLAAETVHARVEGGLYQMPLYGDGRVNLNAEAPANSGWHRAAHRLGVPFAAPFIYPPFFAVLIRPLGRLSFPEAFLAWRVCMVCCYLAGAALALGSARARIAPHMLPLWCVALFSYHPFLEGSALGQANSLTFLLLAASMWFLAAKRPAASALFFAAAALIKLTPVLAAPVFLIHRRWRWLLASALWTGVLLALSIGGAGWEAHRHFFQEVLPRLGCGAPIVSNTSLIAYVQELCLHRVFLWQHAPTLLPPFVCSLSRSIGLAAYVLGLSLLYRRRKKGACGRDFAAALLLTFAVSPISWWHHYTVALLPLLYLWHVDGERIHGMLLALWAFVATNAAGFGLLVATSPAVQLTLALIVPLLVLGTFFTVVLAPERGRLSACVPGGARPQ